MSHFICYTNILRSLQVDSNNLMQQAQIFLYANGNTHPPTAIDFDKSLLRDLLFNQSPAKVFTDLLIVFAFFLWTYIYIYIVGVVSVFIIRLTKP